MQSVEMSNFMHESYLSLSSSETDSNVFSHVLHCARDKKLSTMINSKKADILNYIAIHDKTIYLISPVHVARC